MTSRVVSQKTSLCILVIGFMLVMGSRADHWMDWWKPGPTRQEGKRNGGAFALEKLQNFQERHNGWSTELDNAEVTSEGGTPSTEEWTNEIVMLEKLIRKLKERRTKQN